MWECLSRSRFDISQSRHRFTISIHSGGKPEEHFHFTVYIDDSTIFLSSNYSEMKFIWFDKTAQRI